MFHSCCTITEVIFTLFYNKITSCFLLLVHFFVVVRRNKQGNDRHNAMENSDRYSSPPVEA